MTGPVWPFEQACGACGAEIGERCFPGCVGVAAALDESPLARADRTIDADAE